jgi:hypothetical protein
MTWRRHSGRASRQRTPLWAGDTSPGSGTGPPDQPDIGDGMMGGATRAGGNPRPAVAGAAGDAVEARGLKDLGQGHRRQDGGESPGQHRLARPRGAEEEDVVIRTPASHFASPMPLGMPMDPLLILLVQQTNEYGAMS